MKLPSRISRRQAIGSGAAAVLALAFGGSTSAYGARCGGGSPLNPIDARPERAVSLRQLASALIEGRPARMEGLTRLDGFIIDQENRDIVLWGLAERGKPDLQFADFVVALRSAHGRYTVWQDGVEYIANPLISIDPDPAVFKRLHEIDLMSSSGRKQHEILCRTPQTVRVEGMPRNSRVAKVLVEADYRMKQVSQGVVQLPIRSPFISSHEAQVVEWRRKSGAGPRGRNTRYWFQPGRFTFQASDEADTVFLDNAEVVLNDEDQSIKAGALVASGATDKISREFACAWTKRMEDIYEAEPVWRDMHNIFRHFALARVIRDQNAIGESGLDADFLLDRYTLPVADVPDTIEGLGRVEQFKNRTGTTTHRQAFSVCGGVTVGFAEPLRRNPDEGGTKVAGRSVLVARPALTAISWAVVPGALKGIFGSTTPEARREPVASERVSPGKTGKPSSLKDLFKTK